MQQMTVLSFAACTPDTIFAGKLPFVCSDMHRDCIPPALRRRSSQAMQLAFTSASAACEQAQRSPETLPALFASVAGEIQTTDQLCHELVKADGLVSPSAFHNSVQNSAAGYWSIAHHCTLPCSAIAAGQHTAAMALLETWCQLSTQGGELLLVCYDEIWPAYLAPGLGKTALAYAMVLSADDTVPGLAKIGMPKRQTSTTNSQTTSKFNELPILEMAPLLGIVASAKPFSGSVELSPDWVVSLTI